MADMKELLAQYGQLQTKYNQRRQFKMQGHKNKFDNRSYLVLREDDDSELFVIEQLQLVSDLLPLVQAEDYTDESNKKQLLEKLNSWQIKLSKIKSLIGLWKDVGQKWKSVYDTLHKSPKMTAHVLSDEKELFRQVNAHFSCPIDHFRSNYDGFKYMFEYPRKNDKLLEQFQQSKSTIETLLEQLSSKRKRIDKIFENIERKKREKEQQGEQTIVLDITEDMYCGSMSLEVVADYTCMLCYGIVMDPIKCATCNNLLCRKCVNQKKLQAGQLECYKKCGSSRYAPMSQLELSIYNSLLFRCQNPDCERRIPLMWYREHMRSKCQVQTYEEVLMPQGACNQFDNYGRQIDPNQQKQPKEDEDDLFTEEDDEFGSPYQENLQIGDLDILFFQEEESDDENEEGSVEASNEEFEFCEEQCAKELEHRLAEDVAV